ncbi:MAG: hypothetical protein ABSG43_01505 [Solirubrobacteraceae bacterium]
MSIIVVALALAAYLSVGTGGAVGAVTPNDESGYARFDYPLCSGPASTCADSYDSPGDEYVGHDEPSLEFKSVVPGSGNDITYTVTPAHRSERAAQCQRRRQHDVELRAAANVLVRRDAVRHRVGTGVHQDVHA